MKNNKIHKNLIFVCIFLVIILLMMSLDGRLLVNSTDLNDSIYKTNNHIFNRLDKHLLPSRYYFYKNLIDSPQLQNQEIHYAEKQINYLVENNLQINDVVDAPWSMYCHDVKHTGRSPHIAVDNMGVAKWRFLMEGDSYHCTPIIDDKGVVYVGKRYVYALSLNGSMKWKCDIGGNLGISLAIDNNEIVYATTSDGHPNALNAIYSNNGTIKWRYYTGSDIDSSPVVGSDGIIYFGDWGGNIHAIYSNGTRKWIYKTGNVVTSSAAIGDDGIVFIGSHDSYVYAFYPNNGSVKWRFKTGSWVHGSPTIGLEGTVYISSDDGCLYALNPENGSMIWRCPIGATWCSPALGEDGTLYLGVFEMKFYAINPNGSIKWTYSAPGRIWFGASAALSANGIIYFGTTWMDGGEVAFIALNPNGTERFVNRKYGKFETSPAIGSDGSLYATTSHNEGGYLYAFGPGEQKTFTITEPTPGHFYFLNKDLGETPLGRTIAFGSVHFSINIHPDAIDKVDNVQFYLEDDLVYTDTEYPYEWDMNKRYERLFHYPHIVNVVANFKGGCQWSESMRVLYIHLHFNFQ
jgi:outer membrane protein assembly factor BamB